MANFPLLGDKTGALIALFWTDRYPVYYDCCLELLKYMEGGADETIVIADSTVGALPEYVTRVSYNGSTYDKYFRAGVEHCAANGIGAFYWIGADDIHSALGVANTLDVCMTTHDIAYGDYINTFSRKVFFPAPPAHDFKFDVQKQTWPDSACYRTSIFTEFPPENTPRRFIMSSLRQADEAGKPPTGTQANDGVFYYYQHPRGWNDRTFIGMGHRKRGS